MRGWGVAGGGQTRETLVCSPRPGQPCCQSQGQRPGVGKPSRKGPDGRYSTVLLQHKDNPDKEAHGCGQTCGLRPRPWAGVLGGKQEHGALEKRGLPWMGSPKPTGLSRFPGRKARGPGSAWRCSGALSTVGGRRARPLRLPGTTSPSAFGSQFICTQTPSNLRGKS